MLRYESLIKNTGSDSFSGEERSLQVALHSRGRSIGACIGVCYLLHGLILALFCGPLSHPQETRQQKADLSSDPELQKGIALARKGDFKSAEQAFEKALTLHPLDARVLTGLGQVQEQLGRLAESVETFRKVIEIDPLSSEAHENLGIALLGNSQ